MHVDVRHLEIYNLVYLHIIYNLSMFLAAKIHSIVYSIYITPVLRRNVNLPEANKVYGKGWGGGT
jgi:hypothetical protein